MACVKTHYSAQPERRSLFYLNPTLSSRFISISFDKIQTRHRADGRTPFSRGPIIASADLKYGERISVRRDIPDDSTRARNRVFVFLLGVPGRFFSSRVRRVRLMGYPTRPRDRTGANWYNWVTSAFVNLH